eukprot:TRINITY_DN14478_c0_g1_i1.p1 TRINITY_DN14478_c0_g1~~TRINITY_DN14478_c0_g1_i1.p1  ORF type:complete len:310 (-),score=52.81 TRINITY_DN14478_c0_g1_i1:65-994(-)
MQLSSSRSFVRTLLATVTFSQLSSVVLGVSMPAQPLATLPAKINVSSATGLVANKTHSAYDMPTMMGRSPIASAVANRTPAATDEQNSSKLSPGSSKPELQTVVGNFSQILPKRSPNFMSPTVVSPDKCSCEFQNVCSCEAVIQFMNCINDRCNSGACACEENQFHHACNSIAGACSIEMLCSPDTATCVVEEESHFWRKNRTKTTIYEELLEFKERKCRLEMAADDGWLNADLRLRSVSMEIEKRMQELRAMQAPLPEMHCGKHFQEWHEVKQMQGDNRSGARREAPRSLMLQICATFVAFFVAFFHR